MPLHFIDGTPTAGERAETLPVIDPSTGAAFDTIPRGTRGDVDRAVAAARRAADDPRGAWARTPPVERGRILARMAALIRGRKEELAQLEARDTGKPISHARNDIEFAARYCEYYGGAPDKLHGLHVPYLNDYDVTVRREPYGVTAHILPWNYPAQMFGRTVVPSLAVGNAAVLKPSEDACLSPLALAAIAHEAGLPAGALNVVTGLGEEAGAALAAHPGIDYMSFTGSPEVGTLVQKAAAERHVKCVLELGGKSPHLVFADADLDLAVPTVVRAITQNTGQTCSAGSRVLVQRAVHDALVEKLVGALRATRAGAPAMDCDCGPLINAAQKRRVEGFVARARASGIPLLAEGRIAEGVAPGGFFVAPMLFGAVPRGHELACDEVFGPVLAVLPFDDEDDAVALANATDYGLIAAVWTRDGGRQQRVARRLQCGQVFVNCYGAGGGVELPFGGVKKSGHGREKGFVALEEFTRLKTVVQWHGQ